MNRKLVPALLIVCAAILTVASEPASAQYPYHVAWGQPQVAAVGPYLSPTAAYPLGSMYYPTALSLHPGSHLHYRVAQAEPAATPNLTPVPEAQPEYAPYNSAVQCQCERCRRARGEWSPRRGVLGELWELEQRKNAFLKRLIFGD